MEKILKSQVKYVEYTQKDSGFNLPNYHTKTFVKNSYKTFYNTQYKTAKLSPSAYHFLHFICEKMDQKNNIIHTKNLRSEFIDHLNKNCSIKYKDDTVKKSFAELVKNELIIDFGKKSDYVVNPFHFFKDTEEKRKKLIHELFKFAIRERGNLDGNNLYTILGISESKDK